MPIMKAKTKKNKGGGAATETTDNDVFVAPRDIGIVFAETKPCGLEGQGYEPMGYNQRFYEIQDALPVHPLPTATGLRFEALLFGTTTPIVYTAPAPNPTPVPFLCPRPWVGHSEAVVPGPRPHRRWRTRSPKLCRRLVTWCSKVSFRRSGLTG